MTVNIINLFVQDIIQFGAEHKMDLCDVIMFIDYKLSTINIDSNKEVEVNTFITNMTIINNLILLLGVITNYSDIERKAYNNDLLIGLLENPVRITKYQNYKIKLYNEKYSDKVKLFNQYIEEQMQG